MTNRERELIVELAANSITKDFFLDRFPRKVDENSVLELIEASYNDQNYEDLECAILLTFIFSTFSNKYVDILCKLIVEDWHFQHENVAMILQKLKQPESVDSLYRAIQIDFEYLSYNDCEALITKCAWALGDINTDYSKEKLRLLSHSDNKIVADAALYQLNRLNRQ